MVNAARGRAGAEIAGRDWIVARSPLDSSLLSRLLENLGRGESEALALAVELRGDSPVLTDDDQARRAADRLGVPFYGSAGVLGLARDVGLIPEVRPLLDRLRMAGLYLSDRAYRDILGSMGEAEPL